MSGDPPTDLRTRLSEALHAEADAGFPRLMRIPSTGVVQFLDFLGDLADSDRQRFCDQQADWWAAILSGRDAVRPDALERLGAIRNAPGPLVGGPRYMGARDFRNVVTIFGSRARWLSGYSGRQLEIRKDLIPDEAMMVPAKAALLRKVLNPSLSAAGYKKHKSFGQENFLSDNRVLVMGDFGQRGAQFRYDVMLDADGPAVPIAGRRLLNYEGLWGVPAAGWDMLTEENAERCMGAVAGLVEETVRVFGGVPRSA